MTLLNTPKNNYRGGFNVEHYKLVHDTKSTLNKMKVQRKPPITEIAQQKCLHIYNIEKQLHL